MEHLLYYIVRPPYLIVVDVISCNANDTDDVEMGMIWGKNCHLGIVE